MSLAGPVPVFDPGEIFPDLEELRTRATEGDLPGALERLVAIGRGGASDQVTAWEVLAESDALDGPLTAHLAAHPDDRTARLLACLRRVRAGSDRAAALAAEQDLVRLVAEDRTDATAWFVRLVTAGAAGLGPSETRRRYERLRELAPEHSVAQRLMLRALVPTTGGAWDEALAHVRLATADAPDGSPDWGLVPLLHLMRWHVESPAGETDYLRQPEVRSKLEEASERFTAAPCTSPYAAVEVHTDFAVATALAGQRGRSMKHFRALGPALAPGAWELAAAHRADLETVRGAAVAEGRRR